MRGILRSKPKKRSPPEDDLVNVNPSISWRPDGRGHLRPNVSYRQTQIGGTDISETSQFLHDGDRTYTFTAPTVPSSHFFNETHSHDDEVAVPDSSLQDAGEQIARQKFPSVRTFDDLDWARRLIRFDRTTQWRGGDNSLTTISLNFCAKRPRLMHLSVLAFTVLHARLLEIPAFFGASPARIIVFSAKLAS